MSYRSEEDMYPDVRNWLKQELESRIRDAEFIETYVTHRLSVANMLARERLSSYFSDEYQTYDIKVDVTGVIVRKGRGELVFVECKMNKISVRDLSQLLGYSVIAKPRYSLIISPKGVAETLSTLLVSFKRTDILKYNDERKIALARWIKERRDIDWMTIIPTNWVFK